MESARARAKQDQLAVESKLRKLQEEYARAEGRIKAYEESDYSQSVETILQARNTESCRAYTAPSPSWKSRRPVCNGA